VSFGLPKKKKGHKTFFLTEKKKYGESPHKRDRGKNLGRPGEKRKKIIVGKSPKPVKKRRVGPNAMDQSTNHIKNG